LAAKIRVYELARELGLTNKETLDLCDALGVGVKSHSSSIVDAQADRIRRKADRDGLRRDVQPPEPEAEAKPRKAPTSKPAEAPSPADQEPVEAVPAAPAGPRRARHPSPPCAPRRCRRPLLPHRPPPLRRLRLSHPQRRRRTAWCAAPPPASRPTTTRPVPSPRPPDRA
jgi:translation initiation factor IF-2